MNKRDKYLLVILVIETVSIISPAVVSLWLPANSWLNSYGPALQVLAVQVLERGGGVDRLTKPYKTETLGPSGLPIEDDLGVNYRSHLQYMIFFFLKFHIENEVGKQIKGSSY